MNVLFICTGNVFRSMTADYALRHASQLPSHVTVNSAGIIDAPHGVLDFVSGHMTRNGIDVSDHQPRKLTQDMLDQTDLAVAMGRDHQEHVAKTFGRDIPLFNQVAFDLDEPMPDIWEVLPNWRGVDEAKGHAYAWNLMDRIFEGIPMFVERMGGFVHRD